MTDLASSPYVAKSRGWLLKRAIVTLIVGAFFATIGIYMIQSTISQSSATYESVEATVTGELTKKQTVGSRKNKRIEDVRYVDVALADGSTGQVQSDSLQVGETATIFQSDAGKLTESEPERPGIWMWVLSIGAALIGIATLAGAISQFRKRSQLGTLPADAARIVLEVTGIAGDTDGKRKINKISATVRESSHSAAQIGDQLDLTVGQNAVPANIPQIIETRVVRDSAMSATLAVHNGPDGQWWIADAQNKTGVERLTAKS